MITFTPRLTCPEAGNKYYNTKSSGGYSNAIKGKPTNEGCNVLSNCVGYAYGRFNEIGDWGSCKYLKPVNAENFIQYKGDLEVGQTPKLGACMVWRKGNTLSSSDGAGHVAIVEKIVSETEVITSESGYNSSKPFWTNTRKKGTNGNWGAGSAYTFLGFIYNPAPCCQELKNEPQNEQKTEELKTEAKNEVQATVKVELLILKRGMTGEQVKTLQRLLMALGYDMNGYGADGSFGPATDKAVRAYQKANNLVVDGSVGPATWTKLLKG
jgi:surface antigen